MRAIAAVPPHRVLLALAFLAPALLVAAAARSRWTESGALRHAHAVAELARAQEELTALVRLDRLVLDEARARLGTAPEAIARAAPSLPWLSPAALPPVARQAGGIVALFVADAAGTLRPAAPEKTRHGPAASVLGTGFFRRLQNGAAVAIGGACPVAAADSLAAPGGGFVLAEPLDAVASAAQRARAAPAAFAGVIGACIAPRALARVWRARLGPADTLLLEDAAGRTLMRVPDRAPPSAPGALAATDAAVARTPLRVVFVPAPAAWWQAWYPAMTGFALLALALALALAAAARATGLRQLRAVQALAAAERIGDMLRLSTERYRQLYLAAPAALQALDPSWRIVAVNDRWLALLGYRREDVLGRRFESFLAPQARSAAEQDWARLLAGDPPAPKRRRLLRQDGTVLELTLAEQAERSPDGRLRRALGLLIEPVAPVVPAEPGRLDALARVTGGIAHDFNNLLMVVMGSLERLVAQVDRPDTVRRLAGMALTAAERGAGLTSRLLAAAGRQPLHPELVNPNRLLREAAEAIAQAAGPKVEVQFLLSPVLDPVRIDPAQFTAALLALVANAREAMPRGGRLSIETANVAGPTPQTGQILVSLSDTGAGMDPLVLARATEPFFTTRPPGRASGLGLSMAEGFARQSGGKLEIESEPGVGSTIRLLLPRSIDATAAAGPEIEIAPLTLPDEADPSRARPGGAAPRRQAKG